MSDSHGNTRGRWTGTLIIVVGSLLVCLGIIMGTAALWIIGAIIIVAGAVAWNVMEKGSPDRSPH